MKLTITIRLLAILITILIFSGCNESGGDNDTGNSNFNPFDVAWTSGCRGDLSHWIEYAVEGRFIGDSIRYTDVSCSKISRAGRNVLQGDYFVGDNIAVSGGFTATELDMVYDDFSKQSVLQFDPAPYDIACFDPNSNIVYLDLKTRTQDGTTASLRPTTIDFNNAWTIH
jgi:hypothetical protein